ncbi:MAG: shikimate dehydrogenase [Deltaproteobacteria bacterium]|nr:shikimate dehydrogenase [Deltaproteobacteria bacterium]
MKKKLKILGIIGNPVSHSLSPLMQNAALSHLKLPYLYMPFPVTNEELPDFFSSLSRRRIAGFNATIPHKQAVIPFLDSLSREARLIGAVNTVVVKGKKPIGKNTDGPGYIRSLEEEAKYNVKGRHVILLGAGGSARAIAVALGLAGAHEVFIINRTAKKAHDLASETGKKFPRTIYTASSLENIDIAYWSLADLLINATSMGMKGVRLWPLPLHKLPKRTIVSDIVYTPLETPLLKKAKQLKLKTHPGWGMLLYQGALAFEMWTGRKAPVSVMKEVLLEALKKSRG